MFVLSIITMLSVILDYSNLTTSKFDTIKDRYISNIENHNSQILQLSKDQLSWNNLIQPIIDLDNQWVDKAFLEMKSFHTDEAIREYASDTSTELEQFSIDNGMRKDLYNVYKHYYINQYQIEKQSLTSEQISYFEEVMLDFKQLGLDLPDEEYERVKVIKKELSELTSEYDLNLDNYNKDFEFKLDEVPGLPESFVEKHTVDGKLKVNLKYPDFVPMMEYCQNRDIRKQLSYEYKRRAYDTNVEIAEKVFKLRKEQATQFGFEHHSDYKLQDTMAGSTKSVNTFLDNVKSKIGSLLERDLTILRDLAKIDGIDKLESWDVSYYSRIYTEQESKLNKEDLKKYFPVERTIKNVFNIYQQLLGYTFIRTNEYDKTLWHPEVSVYEVYEKVEKDEVQKVEQSEAILKGYFYLDLFPREGKYGHAAVFPFISKSVDTKPVAAMACNFAKDFMTFDELETFFHEFGHVMHHISSKSTISDTAGFACEGDFVETPSQMFEEWCYVPQTLKMISEEIDDDVIFKINIQRKLLQGYHYTRQLLFAKMDMHLHSNKYEGNSYEVVRDFTKDLIGFDTQENTNDLASFGHLMHGYDASYYGYMWSLAYAKDLFSAFIGKEVDSQLGQRFKEQVLSQGSIRPSMESVREFLGREPNEEAFIQSIE